MPSDLPSRLVLLTILFFFPLWGNRGKSCPSIIRAKDLKSFAHMPHDQLILVTKESWGWKRLPLQIDPMDHNGKLTFSGENNHHRKLEGSDRLVFSTQGFKSSRDRSHLPCNAKNGVQISTSDGIRSAFLINCHKMPEIKTQPVLYQSRRHALNSRFYHYSFYPKNHILFKKIILQATGRELASHANLTIKADLKNFFTVFFDPDDIESRIEKSRVGSVGAVARVSFFLKFLFFKFRLRLTTDVSFYEDAAYVPMIIHLPSSGRDRLEAGSGIVYIWKNGHGVSQNSTEENLPKMRKGIYGSRFQSIASLAQPFCGTKECRFSFVQKIDGFQLAMNFNLSRYLVDSGFFPMKIDTTDRLFMEDYGFKPGGDLTGFYFETSGLKAGNHVWDFWLQIKKQSQPFASECPEKVVLKVF